MLGHDFVPVLGDSGVRDCSLARSVRVTPLVQS